MPRLTITDDAFFVETAKVFGWIAAISWLLVLAGHSGWFPGWTLTLTESDTLRCVGSCTLATVMVWHRRQEMIRLGKPSFSSNFEALAVAVLQSIGVVALLNFYVSR